jgi:signal transduction histidine kinase
LSPYEILSQLPYFSELPEEMLESLSSTSEVLNVTRGQEVIVEGTMLDGLLVVAEGTFEATRRSGKEEVRLGEASAGEVLGEMSILEDRPASATVRALEPGTLVKVPVEQFHQVLSDPRLVAAMFSTVTKRLRDREAALIQSEKLASLGVLTAGLLHEVNNPAAAISRAATHLASVVGTLMPEVEPVHLTTMQRIRSEDEFVQLLLAAGIDSPADLAASLVAQGWTVDRLLSEAATPDEQVRLTRLIHTRQLATEVVLAAGRITELVVAVKRWAYTGQGPVQDVDVNQTIADSTTLLKHKTAGLKLTLETDEELPSVSGRGVELSQVMTNLLDNALGAAAAGVIVRTRSTDDEVTVEFEDDGPGIAPELLTRIWEPFFTTKPPGQGSGLGLPITRRIVAAHGGRIEVESVPGSTVFRVILPRAFS